MVEIQSILQTVYFRKTQTGLENLVQVTLTNDGSMLNACLLIMIPGSPEQKLAVSVAPGVSEHDVYLPEIQKACKAEFFLAADDIQVASHMAQLEVQRKWVVHVIQLSHHDAGYTDLPSLVLREHDQWLDQAIDYAEQTELYPDDAKFRIVIEQAWSIDHYLKHMPAPRTNQIIDLMRSGRFELTALFGNMTTELVSHEALARMAYHAYALKRKYNIPVISAEHNDITGISWGVSRLLTEAGIKIFCPGIPLYYDWDRSAGLQSFWDQVKIFGHDGPGAFWWESPVGKRVLFWCGNSGCGGSSYRTLPDLAPRLKEFEKQGYPWSVMRWPVVGGARDNSPYIIEYAHTIKAWNEQWAYPKLICSTNARFYQDLTLQDLSTLPVWRGELAGQDYPSGATSTAATAVNRHAQATLASAESMATIAANNADYRYPQELLNEAYEETLWHNEHAWGFHFPAGPAMLASQHEKELHAYRADALAHGIANKSMAAIADRLQLDNGFHLVVFNMTAWTSTAPVRTPLREIDNSGSEMTYVPSGKDPKGIGFLKGYVLGYRFHTVLPQEFVDGHFKLVDLETGRTVQHQIVEIDSAMDPQPFSPERLGIGSGTCRYGQFEIPTGLKRDLCFIAEDVPAMGYRSYRFVPASVGGQTAEKTTDATIENEYYRVKTDHAGSVSSIIDKETGRELVDASCSHPFFRLLVRRGNSADTSLDECMGIETRKGPVISSIRIQAKAMGHPMITKSISVYAGIKKIYLDVKVLKDSTPLLNAHVGFPFSMQKPRFRYEGGLSEMNPIRDYLPGSYSDTVAVQNWVKISDDDYSVLWSSVDAPIVGFAQLWPGYVSPAHRCMINASMKHAPQTEDDLSHGWIYSQLYNNNFGTNFSVSQCGESLFRYVLSTESSDITDAAASRLGWQTMVPLNQIMTDRASVSGSMPPSASFLSISSSKVAVLAFKMAEDGHGTIVRIWNRGSASENIKLSISTGKDIKARRTNICEEDYGPQLHCQGNHVSLKIDKDEVCTLRITD